MRSLRAALRIAQHSAPSRLLSVATRPPDALVLTPLADAAARSAVTAAQECAQGGQVDVLITSEASILSQEAETASRFANVRTVYAAATDKLAESAVSAALARIADYTHVIAPATAYGRGVLPRLAGVLCQPALSDVISIGEQTATSGAFTRPIYAGAALARVRVTAPQRLLTIRAPAFAAVQDGDSPARIINAPASPAPARARWIRANATRSARPDLATARVVVAGGRGLKSAAQFATLEALADALGAAVGATRAAVDSDFCPNDMQIGQTGKVVAPDLYVAVGISGAIQHIAGIKDSKVIVAINKDPEAPIFQIADYGIVGDLFDIVPELTERIKQIRADG